MSRLAEIEKSRRDKLEKLKAAKINPYPARVAPHKDIAAVAGKLSQYLDKSVVLVGRLRAIRGHGQSAFADLEDATGRFQLHAEKDKLADNFAIWSLLDVGDFVEAEGRVFKTKTGEPTLKLDQVKIISKSLLPLPEKYKGLKDQETRLRKRYLDLLADPQKKDLFIKRDALFGHIREFYKKHGYIEVQTPILQVLAGGALAEPFVTRHRTLDIDLYLRIALELYLKRLVVGGMEKVFEIGPVFRNEGMSREHLQEFYMLESYQAYADYEDYMKFSEDLTVYILEKTFGTLQFKFRENEINFKPPWPKLDFTKLVEKDCGINIDRFKNKKSLLAEIKKKKIKLALPKKFSWAKLTDELYKTVSRSKIIQPAFLVNHPRALSPLAKAGEGRPDKVERYQLLVAGFEIFNGFSEINDPLDQAERFREQVRERQAGDREAHSMDDDFVEALKYGMPPTAGLGFGPERLLAVVTDQPNIREAVLFPVLRPRS